MSRGLLSADCSVGVSEGAVVIHRHNSVHHSLPGTLKKTTFLIVNFLYDFDNNTCSIIASLEEARYFVEVRQTSKRLRA